MGTATNAIIKYEAGPDVQPLEFMTDDGDNTNFTATFGVWSQDGTYAPKVLPYGVISGGKGTPSTTNDQINISAATLQMPNASAANADHRVSLSAQSGVAVTRAATLSHQISSVTVTEAGAVSVVAGTEGSAFSETYGVAGGPPLIPVDSVELFQVRLSSGTAGLILQSEIWEVPGQTRELAFYPGHIRDDYDGTIAFDQALRLNHTGAVPKKVGLVAATVALSNQQRAADWVPPANTYSVNSTPRYGGAEVSTSTSTGAGTFTVFLENGIRDPILDREGKKTWIYFYPDKDEADFEAANGLIGFAKSNPADSPISASVTIAAESPAERVLS